MKVILFLLCTHVAFAQSYQLQKQSSFPLTAQKFIGVDKYDFIYFTHRNTLYKQKNNEHYEYRDIQFGVIESVDITNPLQPLLFFRDANSLVILDNRLNERKRIKFDNLRDQRNIDFASVANEQSVWLFNIDAQELEIYDFNRDKNIIKSLPITKEVVQMKSNFNFCFILVDNELRTYNSYGSMLEKKNIQLSDFSVFKNNIIGYKDLVFWYFDSQSWHELQLLEDISPVNFYLNNQKLYIYDGKKVHIYTIISK